VSKFGPRKFGEATSSRPKRPLRISPKTWKGSACRRSATVQLKHVPVMPGEVIELLQPKQGQTIVDGTVGGAGHSRLIAEAILPGGRLIAIDRDEETLARARAALAPFGDAVTFVHDDFRNLSRILSELGVTGVHGV